ncbi:hypothetical protein HDV05_003237, partial [Chytridiales sp. JEL 0842]
NELDHEVLTKWATALDFDDYVLNWMSISTTGRSDDPSSFDIIIRETIGGGHLDQHVHHAHGDSTTGGVRNSKAAVVGDPMMAEIDLFKKITEESGMPNVTTDTFLGALSDMVDGTSQGSKSRPWSARSGRSFDEMFLTDPAQEF